MAQPASEATPGGAAGGGEAQGVPGKGGASKKPTTKAERRALQEKQRAAKAAARGEAVGGGGEKKAKEGSAKGPPPGKAVPEKKSVPVSSGIVGHLPPFARQSMLTRCPRISSEVHPAILSLGLRYASGEVDGANMRCAAMLAAFKAAIADYRCPPDVAVSRDLDKKLKSMFQFLVECRPHSVSMGAAIKHLRAVVARLGPETTEDEAKAAVVDAVETFTHQRLALSGRLVADRGAEKIRDGDVVLTFGAGGDAVRQLFAAARRDDKRFRVVVVDARPALAGRALLSFLRGLDLEATYVLLNAVAYAVREATTVFVGAEAVYSNGAALADAGTAALALVAATHNVPVLVCCETYKFHAKVQLDSLSWNELGDPDHLRADDDPPDLDPSRLHLRFDVTPDKYITAVITEHGLVPPSACAALLRELELGTAQPDP